MAVKDAGWWFFNKALENERSPSPMVNIRHCLLTQVSEFIFSIFMEDYHLSAPLGVK